jgi:hypothetical protein
VASPLSWPREREKSKYKKFLGQKSSYVFGTHTRPMESPVAAPHARTHTHTSAETLHIIRLRNASRISLQSGPYVRSIEACALALFASRSCHPVNPPVDFNTDPKNRPLSPLSLGTPRIIAKRFASSMESAKRRMQTRMVRSSDRAATLAKRIGEDRHTLRHALHTNPTRTNDSKSIPTCERRTISIKSNPRAQSMPVLDHFIESRVLQTIHRQTNCQRLNSGRRNQGTKSGRRTLVFRECMSPKHGSHPNTDRSPHPTPRSRF